MPKWLLVSDLDETLHGDSDDWAEFVEVMDKSPEILVALNSSRPWRCVVETLLGIYPPLPLKASISGMGTEIRVDGRLVSQWNLRFNGWNRSIVERIMSELGFEQHPLQYQSIYKASFCVPQGSQSLAIDALRNSDQEFLVVCSGASDFDVLPPQAGKGAATLFLSEHLGISQDHLIVAGDSANDLAMFEVAQKGIVVGNARSELRYAADPAKVYFARGFRAAGVLEGLRFWNAPLNL